MPAVYSAAADTITDLKATKSDTALHITATASDPAVWTNTQLLLDTDSDPKTGYHLAEAPDQGFDYMIEGSTVYRFQGTDPAAWSWSKLGTATRKTDGKSIMIDVDILTLDAESIGSGIAVVLRSLSADYQHVLAVSPVAKLVEGKTPAENPPAATHSLTANFKQDGSDLVIKVTAAKAADLATLLIFFDTDCDASTGFLPPADPHFGFEQMIQGDSLLLHTGDARDGWSWKTAGPVKVTTDGVNAEYRFNAALLKSNKVQAAVWQMSPDWQSRTDRFPADDAGTTPVGTMEVDLDASKLHAEVERPPLPFAAPRADRSLPARERFAKAASYYCFYGADHTSDLSHFDAVIIHTPAQTPDDVHKLNELGVVTLGYISVGEDDQLNTGNGKGPGGKASWYFDKNSTGQPDKNGTWNSWYANAADSDWRANRVAEAKRLCDTADGGLSFSGIFLDTIETCDAYPQSRIGMIQLVSELRAALPNKVIVINRGFSLLKEPKVCSAIDGLMFESFSDSYDFDSKSYVQFAPQDMDATRQVMVRDVIPAMKKFPLRVLALDYCAADQTDRIQTAFNRAATFGMLPAVAPIFLDKVYDTTNVVAKADEKYLSKQVTPQSLAITMDHDQNGFPAGTHIEPSSCFLGYSVSAIIDGIKDRQSLNWSKAAWASAEDPGQSQQLEFTFPSTVSGGNLLITFAFDNAQWRTSKQLRCETKASDDSLWINVPITINFETATCALPATPIHRLRIVQDAGQGSSNRPDLMWIAQVERAK